MALPAGTSIRSGFPGPVRGAGGGAKLSRRRLVFSRRPAHRCGAVPPCHRRFRCDGVRCRSRPPRAGPPLVLSVAGRSVSELSAAELAAAELSAAELTSDSNGGRRPGAGGGSGRPIGADSCSGRVGGSRRGPAGSGPEEPLPRSGRGPAAVVALRNGRTEADGDATTRAGDAAPARSGSGSELTGGELTGCEITGGEITGCEITGCGSCGWGLCGLRGGELERGPSADSSAESVGRSSSPPSPPSEPPSERRPLMTFRGRKCSRCWRRIQRSRSTSWS